MVKEKHSRVGEELARVEPRHAEHASRTASSPRRSVSSVVAFIVAAAFGLTVGGAFASEAGILPPMGGEESTILVDESPAASTDPTPDPGELPEDVPSADPSPREDEEEDEDEDEEEDEEEDEDEDEEEDEEEDEDEDEDEEKED